MKFRILGRFELISEVGEPIVITRRLIRGVIFACVLYRNEPLSLERLIDLLWGMGTDTDRIPALRSLMWQVRHTVPHERLVTGDREYRLHIEATDQVDVDRFRELRRQGHAALSAHQTATAVEALDEALRLWGSGQLSGLLPATPAMSSLVSGLTEEHRDTRNALIQVRLTRGEHQQLLPELRALVTAEPDSEWLWSRLMLALYRCGLKTAAASVFAEAEAALRTHTGVEPGPDIRELRREIEAGEMLTCPDASVVQSTPADEGFRPLPRQLPADLMDFTGRADEAGELIGLLSPSGGTAVPVAEVNGPPGVGKTALAVRVAHAVAHDYPDGQLYVRLGGASPQPLAPEALLGDVLRALGVPADEIPQSAAQRAAMYRSRLAGYRVLVVLDDAASPAQVRLLIPGGAGCAVIITSRARLATGRSLNITPLEHLDALRMLARIAGRARLDAEPDATTQVLDACGGLPLAVRIAGERLAARPAWPVTYLARSLADQHHRLDELTAGDLAVRASVASSYLALKPPEQRLFRLLALIGAHDFPGWVADVLLDAPAPGLITTLVDHCLLTSTGLDTLGQPRYRFHDLLRDYATELAATDPEADRARDRLLTAWTELADHADAHVPRPLYAPCIPRPALEPSPVDLIGETVRQRVAAQPAIWFGNERRNLLTAIDAACAAGAYRHARELAVRTASYLHLHSYHEDAERMWTTVAAAADHAGDVVAAARSRLRAAIVATADRGHHYTALPLLDDCVRVFETAGDHERFARACGVRAYCAQAQGHLRQARRDAEGGLHAAQASGDRHGEFLCLRMLGLTFSRLGNHPHAISCCEHALVIARDLGEDTYIDIAVHAVARARLMAGRPDGVIELCRQGLALSETSGHRLGRGFFHHQLGLAYQQRHQHTDAINSLTSAANDFRSRRERYQEAVCLRSLAESLHTIGRHTDAITELKKSAAAFTELGIIEQEQQTRAILTRYLR